MIQTNPRGDGFIDTATGRRFVPVGTNYADMLDMKRMFTDDRHHETWWHDMVRDYPGAGRWISATRSSANR